MDINVVSWNMQGWGSIYGANEKKNSLFRTIQGAPKDTTVIMLQECGDPEKTGMVNGKRLISPNTGETFICQAVYSDPTAYVRRCTTAILVSENIRVESSGILMPYGVARPLVCVVINGICYGTIHAIANRADSVLQVKASLKELSKNYVGWVLMGDFNSSPNDYAADAIHERLNEVLISGTVSRPGYKCKMIFSKNPTQGENGARTAALDFAFISSNAGEANIMLIDTNTKVINMQQFAGPGKYLSDHNLVGLRLTGLE